MGRKSKVELLHPQLRQAVDELVRGGATIERIVEHLHTLAPGVDPAADLPSESAVGRYKQRAEQQMAKFRQAQAVAKVWVERFGAEPEGDVGRLVTQMLRTVAFQTVANMDGDEGGDAQEIMFLAKALKELSQAERLAQDMALKSLTEFKRETARKLDAIEQEVAVEAHDSDGKRIDATMLRRIREEVYGIV